MIEFAQYAFTVVTMFSECTMNKQHVVVQLFWVKGLFCKDINNKEIFPVYAEKLSLKGFNTWYNIFLNLLIKTHLVILLRLQ